MNPLNIEKIKQALSSDKPADNMAKLIPENQIERFRKFAKKFGITEEEMNRYFKKKKD